MSDKMGAAVEYLRELTLDRERLKREVTDLQSRLDDERRAYGIVKESNETFIRQIRDLQSRLEAARKLAAHRAIVTKDQGQSGEAESWRKMLDLIGGVVERRDNNSGESNAS